MAKILIADDSLAELQIFRQALSSTGHTVVTVMDGDAAEERIRAEKIDLPPVDRRHDLSVIAPAEIEVE